MKKWMLAAAASVALAAPMAAEAAAVVGGSVGGPDGSFSINWSFFNSAASTVNVTSLSVNGATATPNPLVWDSLTPSAPPGATVGTAGLDTHVVVFTFGGDGWNPGETFNVLGVDPDTVGDPFFGAIVSDLIGTTVTFGFSDNSSQVFRFVDDPGREAGLILSAVPEPATWAMMIVGFGLAGTAIRRRRAAAFA